MTAALGELWTRFGEDICTGHLGPDNWDRTAETDLTGKVGLIVNLDRAERTART
jgi:hypothetical protein